MILKRLPNSQERCYDPIRQERVMMIDEEEDGLSNLRSPLVTTKAVENDALGTELSELNRLLYSAKTEERRIAVRSSIDVLLRNANPGVGVLSPTNRPHGWVRVDICVHTRNVHILKCIDYLIILIILSCHCNDDL